ncbi:hypothetical protein HPB52_000138 [Rhipicephalus sanguineus]|uniref:Uncharacterized protein n=1 Tax=Rhipicephalus sanguineus TaxID=34632 RepID=A0A9D4T131_RHISA|nr:hypothetical protein HPB52_000138 [Rhipicephalus sanguineus]
MDETPATDRGTAGGGGTRLDAPGPSRGAARDASGGDRPADGSGRTAIRFLQINLDHARLASANLTDAMKEGGFTMALVSDPYRPGKKLPKPPSGFQYIAADNDPAAALLVARAPFDLCPLLITPSVVAVRQFTDQPGQTTKIMAADPVIAGLHRMDIVWTSWTREGLPLHRRRRRTPGRKRSSGRDGNAETSGCRDATTPPGRLL